MPGENNTPQGGSHFADPGEPRRTPRFKTPDASSQAAPAAARQAASQAGQVPSPDWDDSRSPASVGADVAAALDTLAPGQGAVVTTRDTAAEAADAARAAHVEGTGSFRIPEAARPHVKSRSGSGRGKIFAIIFGIAALAALAVVFILPRFIQPEPEPQPPTTLVTEANVAVGEGIDFGGYTYSIRETDEGHYVFTRLAAGSGDPLVLFEVPGSPTSLILSQGIFLIPENTAEGWNVVAYTMGEGSEPTYVMNPDGSNFGGEGTIAAAATQGTDLVVTDSSDAVHVISLV